ncbi:hypothetical protein DEIPH_ctg031orf0059 [Deinococcus phoenicis]|uniref:Lipoprotein n=1 Tax=Deinococcus phoenicis TaxID=1476583 RepID=A0A016QP42_9DEIO|nr:hypothetical protein DEIPH_ctg031orf0059 [Deinococcus phoenicis]
MWLLPLAAALLSACGTLAGPPTPTAGDLLAAPTALQVAGRSLRVEATPTLDGATFNVQVRVQASRASPPPLTVTGVYVVTEDGVWSASSTQGDRQPCGAAVCLQGSGRGTSRGLRSGEGVQVVVGLKDARGRTLWLRDAQATIGRD